MRFVYEGFTDNGNNRCFQFSGTDGTEVAGRFLVEVKLLLFSENRILVQEGPGFCLQLLETASLTEPANFARFRRYTVVGDDFRPLLAERARKTAAKIHKAARRPFRKPAPSSGVILGIRPSTPTGQVPFSGEKKSE